MSESTSGRVKWYKSLVFLGILGVALVPLWDMGGIFVIMSTRGKGLVIEESSRLMEQVGNHIVSNLQERSQQIEALSRSLANASEKMPKDPGLYMNVIPRMIHFHGDQAVAGGGIWPEPGAFRHDVYRSSFFWGRDDKGILKFYDDYNHGRGYHNDEWYPVVRYSKPGRCFWSRSYMDPYSYQPMVTCTVAIREEGRFSGVSTIDLKLEGLHDFMHNWQKQTGGYIFLLDRNNKFLTFPDPAKVKIIGKDDKGNRTEDFMTVTQFGEKEKLFAPIAKAAEDMNADILKRAVAMKSYRPDLIQKIDNDSDQIDQPEAAFIAAVIADPLAEITTKTFLYKSFEIKTDLINNEESFVYVFHVPDSYWKVILVRPYSQATAVASKITRDLLFMTAVTIMIGLIPIGLFSHLILTRPIRRTTDSVQRLGDLVAENKYDELEKNAIPIQRDDELGKLGSVVNGMASQLQKSYGSLVELNASLERKVEERTHQLEQTLTEVQALKTQQDGDYFLTSLLTRPLAGHRASSRSIHIETFVEQKKKFEFKGKTDEIGGDLVITDSITLRKRNYVFFLNGDAMGKSMQGAGGALVLGAVANGLLERSKIMNSVRDLYPERWLKNAYVELQKVFETFDGSMLVSVAMGLIDEESGVVYHVNAEHPWTVAYRDGKAEFIENEHLYSKLGAPIHGDESSIAVFQMRPGDVLFVGSDGRDDIASAHDSNTGERTMNEDEHQFVRCIEEAHGHLTSLVDALRHKGELTDDLSLIRIEFAGTGAADHALTPEITSALSTVHQAVHAGRYADAVAEIERASEINGAHPALRKELARTLMKMNDYERAAHVLEDLCDALPEDNEASLMAARSFKKLGDLEKAIDYSERVFLRNPHHFENILALSYLHAKRGNFYRARTMLGRALAQEPHNERALKLKLQLSHT